MGLAASLPAQLLHGLTSQGVPAADAARLSELPPVSIMFAALLGYDPIQTLLGPTLAKLPANHAAYLTGHSFFPSLISGPFSQGLDVAFDFAIAACVIAAGASLLRGKRYVHEMDGTSAARDIAVDPANWNTEAARAMRTGFDAAAAKLGSGPRRLPTAPAR